MLFKSTTGDLTNKKLWQNPKKIVYSSIAQSVVRVYTNILDIIT